MFWRHPYNSSPAPRAYSGNDVPEVHAEVSKLNWLEFDGGVMAAHLSTREEVPVRFRIIKRSSERKDTRFQNVTPWMYARVATAAEPQGRVKPEADNPHNATTPRQEWNGFR